MKNNYIVIWIIVCIYALDDCYGYSDDIFVHVAHYSGNEIVDSHLSNNTNPYIDSKYIIMSSKNKINGFYNHIFMTDLFGLNFVIFHSNNLCNISINFDALKNGQLENSLKFFQLPSNNVDCDIIENNVGLFKFDGIIELFNNTQYKKQHLFENNTISPLKITNYSDISNNITQFGVTLSDKNSTIVFNVDYYGYNHTLERLPNIPVGPLVVFINVKVTNLTVSNNTNLSLQVIMGTTNNNIKFNKSLNQFFSDLKTPGVFRSYNIESSPSNHTIDNSLSFFWKAVAYTEIPLRRVSRVVARLYSSNDNGCHGDETERITKNGITKMIPYAFKRYDCIRVDFIPLSSDALYFYTKYLDWSSTIGFKSYYIEKIPKILIYLVIGGYTVPIVVGLIILVFSIVRYKSYHNTEYSEITDTVNEEATEENLPINFVTHNCINNSDNDQAIIV